MEATEAKLPVTTRRWLWAIVLTAAALRLFPIWFGLPYLRTRPDETNAVSLAMGILQGDPNPHFFHWPSLTLYVFAGVFRVVSFVRGLAGLDPTLPAEHQILIGRIVGALAGTLTVAVTFEIGRRCVDAMTGLVAASLLSVALLHVRDSHFAMTDIPMTFFVTASIAVLLRAMQHALEARSIASVRLKDFAAAGLLAGLAMSTKYNGTAVAAAMAVVQVMLLVRFKSAPWNVRAWLPTLAYAAALIAGFFVTTPYAVLDFPTFSADLRHDFHHLASGHAANLGRGWVRHLTHSLPYGAGITTVALAIPGAVLMGRSHPREALVLSAVAVAVYMTIGSGYTVFFRYVLPLIPLICLFAAFAVRAAASWLARRTRLSAGDAVVVLAALVAVPSFVNSLWLDILLARADTRVLAAEWLAPRVRAGDTLHDSGGEYARLELGTTAYHVWHYDPHTNDFGHPAGETPDWLVVHDSPLWTHGRAPDGLRRLAVERYDLVWEIRGTRAGHALVYDLQDAFFMPVAGFERVDRPGPSVRIYRRR